MSLDQPLASPKKQTVNKENTYSHSHILPVYVGTAVNPGVRFRVIHAKIIKVPVKRFNAQLFRTSLVPGSDHGEFSCKQGVHEFTTKRSLREGAEG